MSEDPGTWHLNAETLRDCLAGLLPAATAWSVEAHLTECERCRTLLARLSTADDARRQRLDDGWARLAAVLPPQGAVRAGTRWRRARMLLVGGPAARWAWLTACVVVLVLAAVFDAVVTDGISWLGVIAPLVPVVSVAASYGSRLDVSHEVIAATPAGGLRLLLVRTASVLAATIPVALVAGHVTDLGSPAPWLLACLALTLATMALGTLLGIERAAAVIVVGWVAAVSTALLDPWRRPAVLTAEAMPWMLAVAVVAAAVLAARRGALHHPLSTRESR